MRGNKKVPKYTAKSWAAMKRANGYRLSEIEAWLLGDRKSPGPEDMLAPSVIGDGW